MTEVYINNLLFDLDDETTVAASYGNISFGELSKRKGIKSNQWSGPFSQRNKLIAESSELVGSYSLIPYRKNLIRVEIHGVIVFEGFCTFEESHEGYEVQSFSGASDFYSTITNKKLTELDLSAFNHIWNEPNIRNSWSRIEGYIYAYADYGKGLPFYLEGSPPEFFLPQLFFHTCIKQIATDAGYTLMGDVLTNDRFLKHIVIPNKFPLTITYGQTWILSSMLPDLAQSKMWLDFANIYGLQFDVDELTKEIRADYIDDILFNEPESWTEKVDKSERTRTKYRYDNLGQTSYLKFKSEALTSGNNPVYQDFAKEVLIDDTTLPLEADVYKSEFHLIQDVDPVLFPDGRATTRTFVTKPARGYSGIWNSARGYIASEGQAVWYNGTYYTPILAGTNQPPPTSPTYWKVIAEKDVWEMKSRAMYGALTTDVNSEIIVAFSTPATVTRIINNTNMDWDYTYTHHYRVFERIMQRTKVVEKLIKLSYADVNQADFTRAKEIDGELYVLEEIHQFKLNQRDSTQCNLVRL